MRSLPANTKGIDPYVADQSAISPSLFSYSFLFHGWKNPKGSAMLRGQQAHC